MFIINFFKLVFFLIAVYFFYSVIRMLLFSARSSRADDERMRRDARGRTSDRQGRGRSARKEEIIELDKNQYKVE